MINMQYAIAFAYLFRALLACGAFFVIYLGYRLTLRELELIGKRRQNIEPTRLEWGEKTFVIVTRFQGVVLCLFGALLIWRIIENPPVFDVKRPAQTVKAQPAERQPQPQK